ncbi:unnamed protein product [Closterium sp. NIES-53]
MRGFNGALKDVQGRGTVALQGEVGRQVLIHDVLYVPGMRANLLSTSHLKENGVKLHEDGDGMLLVSAAGDVLNRASYTGRVLCTDLRPCSTNSTMPTTKVVALRAIVSVTKSTPDRLHARLAHVGLNTIQSSAKHEVATGLDLKSASGADLPCVSCVGGKLARHTFPDHGSDADDVLAVVHVDLCGQFRVAAKDGSLYFLLLKDRKTRYVWVRPVAKKSDALQEFVNGKGMGGRQRTERHDGARDEDAGGIGANDAVAHGRAAPLVASHSTAGHLGPQLPGAVDVAAGDDAIPAADREEARLVAGMGMGLHGAVLGPRLLDIADNWVVTTSDVVFYENMSLQVWKSEHGLASGRPPTIPPTDTSMATLPLLTEIGEPAAEDVEDVPSPFPSPAPRAPPLLADLRGLTLVSAFGDEGRSGASPVAPTKSFAGGRPDDGVGKGGREKAAADWGAGSSQADQEAYDDAEEDKDFPELDPDKHTDPKHRWDISTMTVKEALVSWKGKAVKATMEEEIRSLVGMGTWELVERPSGVNIMKNRWVLTTKYHIDDTVEREKARLVVKGFTQVYGANYNETYAPVSSYVTLLSIVAVLDLNLMQLDMKNAYLQSKLNWVLYMYQPDYFNDRTGRGSRRCAAGRWLEEEPGQHGALLQSRQRQGDLLGAGLRRRPARRQQQCSNVEGAEGAAKGRLRAAGDLAGAKVPRAGDRARQVGEEVVAASTGYTDKLRRRFLDKEQNGRTPKTPVLVDAYATLTFDDEEAEVRQEEEYRQKFGLLQFAMTTTRPDIAFACSKLGSGLTVRSDQHWHEVDRCLAYLANTRDTALEFGGGAESLNLVGYVDAEDAGDKQNRTSAGGYVFVFGGAAVSWMPIVLWVDKKAAITLAEGMGLTGKLKHMERQQAWLQHMVKRGKFSLRYIPTAEQPADFLTKALHYPAFNRCSVAIGQVRLVDMGDGDNDVQH